jgi:hypothetical protein
MLGEIREQNNEDLGERFLVVDVQRRFRMVAADATAHCKSAFLGLKKELTYT